MTAFDIHPRQRAGRRLLTAMLKTLQALAHAIARGWQSYRDYRELIGMSDPELQDIGISRSDIFSVVEGTYQRPARPITRQKQLPLLSWESSRAANAKNTKKLRSREISVPMLSSRQHQKNSHFAARKR